MAGVGQHGSTPRIRAVKAVVVDVGWVNGLAAIRSLGRAGIPVFAVDHRSSPLGFRSRYAQPVTVPDPLTDEDGFVDAVARIGGPAVVFPTHDPPLNALARQADRLDGFPGALEAGGNGEGIAGLEFLGLSVRAGQDHAAGENGAELVLGIGDAPLAG